MRLALAGAIEFRCMFDGANGIAISTMLLSGRSAADHPNRWRGAWAFKRAIVRHQERKGIAVAINDMAMAIPLVSGSRFHAPEPLKEETKKAIGALPSAGLDLRQAHDRASNKGPRLATSEGAPLSQCYCRSRDFVSKLHTAGLSISETHTKKTTVGKLLTRRIHICRVHFSVIIFWTLIFKNK